MRALVLARNQVENGGRCTLAIEGTCVDVADCVHHKLGRALTGDHDERYLMAVCTACNRKVGDPQRLPDPPARPVSMW